MLAFRPFKLFLPGNGYKRLPNQLLRLIAQRSTHTPYISNTVLGNVIPQHCMPKDAETPAELPCRDSNSRINNGCDK